MMTFLKEAFGYTAASACALVVDTAILWALVHFLGIDYLGAATVSFSAGALVTYGLSVKIAFKHRRMQDRRTEFAAFVLIGVAGLALNTAVIFVAVEYFGLHYLLGKCVAAGFTFTFNFIVRRQVLFVRRSMT
jgi:putative flippase GtrA